MSSTLVLYTLNIAGNLQAAIPKLSASLSTLKDRATAAGAAVTSSLGSARTKMNELGTATGEVAEGAGKALAGMAALAYGVDQVLRLNREYEHASNRVVQVVKDLGKTIADTFGPKVKGFLDDFGIGLAYIGTLITKSIIPSFSLLRSVVAAFAKTEMSPFLKFAAGDYKGALLDIVEPEKRKVGVQNGAVIDTKEINEALKALASAHKEALEAAKKAWINVQNDANPGGVKSTLISGNGDVLSGVQSALREAIFGGIAAGIQQARDGRAIAAALSKTAGNVAASGAGALAALGSIDYAKMGNTLKVALAASGINTLHEDLAGGLQGVLGAAGPYGAAVGAGISILQDLPGMGRELIGQVVDTLTELPGQIGEFLQEVIPELIQSLPTIVAAFVSLIPILIAETLKAIPLIVKAFIDMFVQAITDALSFFKGDGVSHPFFRDDPDQRAGFHSAGIKLPGDPGYNPATGMRGRGGGRSRGGGGISIGAIHVHGIQDERRFSDRLRSRLGSYGLGFSLDPRKP